MLAAANFAFAQLPQAKLNWIFPPGMAAGSTTEVVISGTDLDEPAALRFSDPRVTATLQPGTTDRFAVAAPADMAGSVVDARFIGRFGASNPRAFVLGGWPEMITASTNISPRTAIELPPGATINGRISARAAAWFKFDAEAGQRLTVRVQARELDSRLVPDLTVTTTDGRELAVVRRREWLDFTAPGRDSYLLKLHDQMFRGGDEYHFRLSVSTGPHLEFALPVVLRAGATNRVMIFGRHLPGGTPSNRRGLDGRPLEQIEVGIDAPGRVSSHADRVNLLNRPASAFWAAEAFRWQWNAEGRFSNPLLFALSTNEIFTAASSELTPVTPPCEYAAFFPGPGENSGVTFHAGKGEVFWLELSSERLGFSSDPHAVVQRQRSTKGAQGETLFADVIELTDMEANFGDREFNTATRDAAARFEAPQSGSYRVLVRDRFNLGPARPRFPYRLTLRPETPDFRLVALPMPPPRAGEDRRVHVLPLSLRRGETVALKVLAFRRDGFNGDIQLSATGLPSGVSAAANQIPAGHNSGALLLTAAADATAGIADIAVAGTATIGSSIVTRSSPLASVVWPVPDFNNEHAVSRLDRESMLSVIAAEPAPLAITAAAAAPLEIRADGTGSVPLKIDRRGEFNAAFNLKLAGHPALDKAKEFTIPENATNYTAEIKLAETKLPAGTHTLWFQGVVAGKYRNNPGAVALAEAELRAADQALAAAAGLEKPKAEERKQAAEAAKKEAEERARPRDVTVPVYSQAIQMTVLPASSVEANK